jgi:hypothetical protein
MYLTDKLVHPLDSAPRPPVGVPFVDPVFGSTMMRLTDSAAAPNNANGSGFLNAIRPEYPPVCPWSIDNAWLLLLHVSYFGLYTGDGLYVADLPFAISASSEPRWSVETPDLLYYHEPGGNTLFSYNVRTKITKTLRVFTEYTAITGGGESDCAQAIDALVLAGDGKEAFIYMIGADVKSPVVPIPSTDVFDSLYIAPAADAFTMSMATTGIFHFAYDGISVTPLGQLCQSDSHMDIVRWAGVEMLVRTNCNDPVPLVNCANGIESVSLPGGVHRCLLAGIPWSLAVHVSCSHAGWALVETYYDSATVPPVPWGLYTNEIIAISLNARGSGRTVYRVAHHHSLVSDYESMPLTAVRRDNKAAVFGSNWGVPGVMDAYLLTLQLGTNGAPIFDTTAMDARRHAGFAAVMA